MCDGNVLQLKWIQILNPLNTLFIYMVRNDKVLEIQIRHSHICAQKKGQQCKSLFICPQRQRQIRGLRQISWILSEWNEDESTKWLVRLKTRLKALEKGIWAKVPVGLGPGHNSKLECPYNYCYWPTTRAVQWCLWRGHFLAVLQL